MNRDQELDALIAAGWGSVPGRLIPPDWRDRKPPAPDEWAMPECKQRQQRSVPAQPIGYVRICMEGKALRVSRIHTRRDCQFLERSGGEIVMVSVGDLATHQILKRLGLCEVCESMRAGLVIRHPNARAGALRAWHGTRMPTAAHYNPVVQSEGTGEGKAITQTGGGSQQ